MKTSALPRNASGRARRARRSKGAEVMEFTFVLLPLIAILSTLLDTAWAIHAKSTLDRAVRIGVRTGITLTAAQMATGACLTDTVKSTVQQNALGLLSGSRLSLVKVHYFQPPAPNSSAPAVDVSAQPNGNAPGNIMQVSVQNFSLIPLMPRIFSWRPGTVDNAPLTVSVSSADMIEPSRTPPCIGSAP